MNKLNLSSDGASLDTIVLNKRQHILITDSEDIRPRGYDDQAYIKWINKKYIDDYKEMLPYHYVITIEGKLYAAKPDFVKTTSPSFAGHEDDVIIYVENDLTKMSGTQISLLTGLCVLICEKYSLNQDSIIFFPYDILNNRSASDNKQGIQLMVRVNLQQKNPNNIVRNSFLDEQKEKGATLSKADFLYLDEPLTIKELSEMTGVPQSIILQQNQHLL